MSSDGPTVWRQHLNRPRDWTRGKTRCNKDKHIFSIFFINLWLTDPDLRAVDEVIKYYLKAQYTCTFNLQVRRWVVFADVSGFELAGVSHPLSVLANLKAALVFATRASIFVILIEIALNLQFQWCLSHLKLYGAMLNSTPKINFRRSLLRIILILFLS